MVYPLEFMSQPEECQPQEAEAKFDLVSEAGLRLRAHGFFSHATGGNTFLQDPGDNDRKMDAQRLARLIRLWTSRTRRRG